VRQLASLLALLSVGRHGTRRPWPLARADSSLESGSKLSKLPHSKR